MTNSAARPENLALGISVILVTVLAMAFTDALVKYASSDFPLWPIYVLRSLVAIPVLAALPILTGRVATLMPRSPGWTLIRSLLLVAMYMAIYAAIPVLPLSVVAAALYTGPLFITLFSGLLIGEPVSRRKWLAIMVGFAGVIVVLRPAAEAFSPLSLIPVAAALFYALAAIITRTRCASERPGVLALALNLCLLATGLAATGGLLAWQPGAAEVAANPFLMGPWITMGPHEWTLIAILAGLIVGVGIGLAKAYQSAPPAVIATFDYAYLGFAAFWGFVFFGDVPDAATVVGLTLIALAGIVVIRAPGRPRAQEA